MPWVLRQLCISSPQKPMFCCPLGSSFDRRMENTNDTLIITHIFKCCPTAVAVAFHKTTLGSHHIISQLPCKKPWCALTSRPTLSISHRSRLGGYVPATLNAELHCSHKEKMLSRQRITFEKAAFMPRGTGVRMH